MKQPPRPRRIRREAALSLLLGVACVCAQAGPVTVQTGPVHTEMKMMDTNGDGRLTREEHATGARRMFEAMDADRNGRVTAAEMDAAHERITGGKPQPNALPAAQKIRVVDADGDGVLSADEHAAGSRRMFDAMDADHDGLLSFPELAEGHRRLQHPPGR